MKALVIPVTPFVQNCTVLYCEETKEAAVVDPGGEVDRIIDAATEESLKIVKVLVTHAHIDHVGGVGELAERLEVPIEGPHEDDKFWIEAMDQQKTMFGLINARGFQPNRWLRNGDTVSFGQVELKVLHCPGHTPGHIAFFHEPSRLAIVGDVLFQGSIGRTDFPGGDHKTLIKSIKEVLFPLGDDVQFLSGHGPSSTFGEEKKSNPFVGDSSFL